MSGYKKLLDEVEEGSLANKELNNAKFEMMRNVNGASAVRENLENRIRLGSLTPENVARELGWQGDGIQHSLDIWNGTADTSLSADSVEEFMKQRLDSRVAEMRADADGASVEDAPFDLRWIRSQMETGSTESANRRDNNRVGSLDEYGQLVTEMTSILHTVEALRDPTNRATLRPDQVKDLKLFMQRLEADFSQARNFLAENDYPELDAVLREQLDKHGLGDLLDGDPSWTVETMTAANKAGSAYRAALDAGKPGTKEAAAYLAGMRDLLIESPNPFLHRTLADAAAKLVGDQITANGGTIPDEMREILRDPAFERFGAFSEVLGRLDVDDLIRDGDIDLREATGGRYAQVEWQDAPAIDPALVSDDRPEGEDDVIADVAWREGMEQVTPNVAMALNSMFTTMGGGIHRVKTDITEANVPQAEAWRAEGWNRGGGSDMRTPEQVEGVYTKDTNLVIVADSRVIVDTGRGSNVIVHELGHALDSMLGETLTEGGWFTDLSPEFKKFHERIKGYANYGDNPEQSLMHWYFRDQDEGAVRHNGVSGNKEVFAEGYAAYAAGLKRLEEMAGQGGPITEDTTYALIGRQLTGERGQLVEWAGELSFEQVRVREVAIGRAIMDYFGDLETNQLPKIMAEPKAMPVRSELRNVMMGLSAQPLQKVATPAEKERANTHNSAKHGLIQMQPVGERGSPTWQEMEQQVKAVSPGATMPPPTAIYVTWNPVFAEQGATVIWKAVMPGVPKYTVEYTDEHKATQLAAKFQRQQRVDTALNDVHAKAEAEAMFDETAALVLAMIETGMRVGSSEKAGSKDRTTGKTIKTFGGATMLKKHVFFPSETLMRFRFPGKAGKENTYESRNPALRAAVIQLLEGKGPSDQVFAGTNSGRSIEYIRAATGIDDVINHDTRTRYATNMARDLVAKWPKSKLPKNEAAVKKAATEVAKKVGAAINDTWTVARDSYISPAVWERFEDSAGIPHSFDDSPPYGLIEGETVTTLVPGAPGGPPAPEGEAPPAPVAAAAEAPEEEPQTDTNPEPEVDYVLDHSPEGIAERQAWYDSFVWPDPPIVAGPDTEVEPDDTQQPDEEPGPESEEVE